MRDAKSRILWATTVLIILVSTAWTCSTRAQAWNPYADKPEPGEAFTHFFIRITRGGLFQGITLEAPKKVQLAFYKRIWRPFWQGPIDLAEAKLGTQGVNLWLDWYKADTTLPLLAPTVKARTELARAVSATEAEDPECKASCRSLDVLLKTKWSEFNTPERQAFAKAMVLKARLFGGRTIVDYLALQHQGSAAEAISHTDIKLVHEAEFKKVLAEAGWNGPIYFRGGTLPSPKDSSRYWIVLNDDLMRKMTPFNSPLLQTLEYVGILTHEMSHVFQNLTASRMGIDLSIRSPEGALLVEGDAELLAERALAAAGESQTFPSAESLLAPHQASEIVNRPGQEEQGNLFPYTVGLPFVASLFDLEPTSSGQWALQQEILRTIAGKQTLQQMLTRLFP